MDYITNDTAIERQLSSFVKINLFHNDYDRISTSGINAAISVGGRVCQCHIQKSSSINHLAVKREYPGRLTLSLTRLAFSQRKLFTVVYLQNQRTLERDAHVYVSEKNSTFLPESWDIDIDPEATYKVRANVCWFQSFDLNTIQLNVVKELRTEAPERVIFTQEQLALLEQKTRTYVGRNRLRPIKVLYRNKPLSYFEAILAGNGVMEPYIKDMNGDPKCPTNGRINGLFFMGRTDRNNPSCLPPVSPFGNTRVIIPVERLFNASNKLYFSDFWCHNVDHYISLVITRPGSEADRFCQSHLLELDKYSNSYLRMDFSGQVYILDTHWVEILYTEAINLRQEFSLGGVQFTNTRAIGRGQSTRLGMPKKRTCRVCNLYV